MKYDPVKHHRRSIRLKDYDYSQAGAYFVTICAQNRECLFGEIVNGEMELNDAGAMVARWWDELPNKFPIIEPDAFVIMPNHIHCIVVITDVGAFHQWQPHRAAPTVPIHPADPTDPTHPTDPVDPTAPTNKTTLGDIMDWFKTMATNEYIRGVKELGWKPFEKKVFQRNYYEHIIRNERELNAIRSYIENNPANWVMDLDNMKDLNSLLAPRTTNDYLQDMGVLCRDDPGQSPC